MGNKPTSKLWTKEINIEIIKCNLLQISKETSFYAKETPSKAPEVTKYGMFSWYKICFNHIMQIKYEVLFIGQFCKEAVRTWQIQKRERENLVIEDMVWKNYSKNAIHAAKKTIINSRSCYFNLECHEQLELDLFTGSSMIYEGKASLLQKNESLHVYCWNTNSVSIACVYK